MASDITFYGISAPHHPRPNEITAYRTPHCLKIKVPVEAKVYRRAIVDGRGRPYKIVMPLRAARVGLVARAIKALRQGIETQ